MSLTTATGPWGLLLDEREEFAKVVEFPTPILAPAELAWIEQLGERDPAFRAKRLDTRFRVESGRGGLEVAVADLCRRAETAVDEGHSLLVLSDRACDEDWAPIPMLLATSAVHHHLIEARKRMQVSLLCDSGEAREDHHFACLIGYGATLVHPWLAYRSVEALAKADPRGEKLSVDEALASYRGAVEKGLLKIMSKMGICPATSYQGAQIFETIGLDRDLVDRYFVGTASRISGVNLHHIAGDALALHDRAYGAASPTNGNGHLSTGRSGSTMPLKRPGPAPAVAAQSPTTPTRDAAALSATAVSSSSHSSSSSSSGSAPTDALTDLPNLPDLGIYRFRKDGEYHALGPAVFKALHKAVRSQSREAYDTYARLVDERPPMTLRDLLDWTPAGPPIPLDDVEPATEIAKRFCTQAMSHGAVSSEAHEALAVAMNRIGAKSNSGEGGEARDRFYRFDTDQDDRGHSPWKPRAGDWANSAIKQVASGRFGVTPEYLVAAKELEIKMAQGSKPGEGGQIPGHKVSEEIASIRRSVPGVTLISPPPHHDIYSIEDLAQLIYDLKRINREARIGVKLVAGAGVGTIAAGVAKGYADSIQLSGHDGGTGASPLGSIRHAGLPWELGLAEAQQVLVRNALRERVTLRVDGGLKTGRDVVTAALLGAEEFGFGTTSLVALGCIMARQCHLNTCPVGVATQKPELRAKFPGEPEHVIAFLMFVAEHVRHILASMGVARLEEIVGRTELLKQRGIESPKGVKLDLGELLADPDPDGVFSRRRTWKRNDRPPEDPLDQRVFQDCKKAVALAEPLQRHYEISNRDRTVGARLSGEIARTWRDRGLPDGTIDLTFHGIAGQSFGAFASNGMRMTLVGEAQDYVGKGMGGGEIVIRPPAGARFESWKNVVLGNTVLYGATGGALFAAGRAGERLAVRNSGAVCVVEGCGDHGCEYMTGGVVVVLGSTGKNFAAGMSGGVAYVLDLEDRFPERLNGGMVREERLGVAGAVAGAGGPGRDEGDGILLELIARHRDLTGSARAGWMLANWEALRGRFWRVEPLGLTEPAAPERRKPADIGVTSVEELRPPAS
jgi:glutamate synthase domain-containing protein 2/glutamate synthase domain-containing protein 3